MIDPQAGAVMQYLASLESSPAEEVSPAEARRLYRESRAALRPPVPPLHEVVDLQAAGQGGPIPLRLYRPAPGVSPAMMFFHGGGWVVGDLETHDVVCRQIAGQSGVAVIAVDYRLAPEHPFPAATDDAWSATEWIADHAGTLAIDSARLAVGGDSAGGGLAAVTALMARDAGLALKYQVLVYPVTDVAAEGATYSKYAEGYFLTPSMMRWYVTQYAPNSGDRRDWRASPLRAPSVRDVAPALVITAALDPLRDEGEAYARRLEDARVAVDYLCLGGMIHGFLTMGGKVDTANRAISTIAATLKQALL